MSGLITTTNSANTMSNENSAAFCIKSLPGEECSTLRNATECPMKEASATRLKALYPFVDIAELPLAWSSKDKANFISLSENNLKVHYKGNGKGHKDAASVRATHPIPQACLLYYYEIKVVSKGRDGYMGIGLAAQNVNMQRLPGWDKQSYGYHGDDGHSFSSSGTGQPYGPTFTTNDVIGCAYNLVENKCFYTKNGFSLGVAFTDLPNVPLYPTVGLQTPGEEVEANFGMEPFVYDIEQDLQAVRSKIQASIINYPVRYNEWQDIINKLVQTWLVHNGYCGTAEVFSSTAHQEFKVNIANVRQRLIIQQLVLSGRIGEAIAMTNRLYPEVLSENANLLFALRCRQFIEMINGVDTGETNGLSIKNEPSASSNGSRLSLDQVGMEVDEVSSVLDGVASPMDGLASSSLGNGQMSEALESKESAEQAVRLAHMLTFGKELHAFSQQLKKKYGTNEKNKKMLRDAFSLLAYADPTKSPLGWQLNPSEREHVCLQLNNVIVLKELDGCCPRPPLEIIIKHTKQLLRLNGNFGAWLMDDL